MFKVFHICVNLLKKKGKDPWDPLHPLDTDDPMDPLHRKGEYFSIIILDGVNNKRMASEISTHQLNLEKFIIPGLKFALRALVICGLFNITEIFTKKIYIIYLIPLVFSNSKLL